MITKRLRLRPRVLADLDACFAMDREPGTLDFIDWPEETGGWDDEDAHRRFIRERIEHPYPPGLGYWVIEEQASPGVFLGWVLLIREDATGAEVEIGWRLHPTARGRGLATEAARAVMTHGFQTIGVPLVISDMYRANTASMNVARKLGMQERADPVRTTERYVLWELAREDWRG
ncbi:MAG: GNAT family N-acetyltransferase [Pseudomonadota bacterium]